MDPKSYERYSRQILFGEIGEVGQQRLLDSSAVIVGCGALGTALANLLVRAGVGKLRIVDRDFVEPSNLQRQTLFEESDAADALPKAVAAERRLRAINSGVAVEGIVADLSPKNAEELLSGFPLILDGTDNFETRFLLNDVAIHLGIPWIYAAVVASYGVTLTVRPGVTACLACALETGVSGKDSSESQQGASENGSQASVRSTGAEDTCDTVGVLGAAAGVIASIEAAQAIKILVGRSGSSKEDVAASSNSDLTSRLTSFDVWTGGINRYVSHGIPTAAPAFVETSDISRDRRNLTSQCVAATRYKFTNAGVTSILPHWGKRIAPTVAEVRENGFLLRFRVPPYEMTVFADGRAIIKGTRDAGVARSLYARYIGT